MGEGKKSLRRGNGREKKRFPEKKDVLEEVRKLKRKGNLGGKNVPEGIRNLGGKNGLVGIRDRERGDIPGGINVEGKEETERRKSFPEGRNVPVEKDEEYVMEIMSQGHEGEGVGRIRDFTVFVAGGLPGEKVKVRIIKVATSYAVGKLLEILSPSSSRVDPFCSVFKRCGGCSLQHMNYASQLAYKTQKVRDNLERIGKIKDCTVHTAIGMKAPLRYRNKVQYPVAEVKGEIAVGFYAPRSHDIISTGECGIQHELGDGIVKLVKEWMTACNIRAYNEETGQGIIRHIVIRVGFKTGDAMVILVTTGAELPSKDRLIAELTKQFPGIKSIVQNINGLNTNVVLGEKNILLYGSEVITDYIGPYKFSISPFSFFQVNPVQTEVLYGKVLEYAQLTGEETVFDLYSGIGTISLFLSQKAKMVYGIEVVAEAVEDARKNAGANGVENVEFFEGEAEKVFPALYQKGIRADVVVVDPPRKGCDERLLETIVEMQPERIVYVSCNPSTLARDLHYLDQRGYRAVEAQPVDMFPHSYHVEAIILLQRLER